MFNALKMKNSITKKLLVGFTSCLLFSCQPQSPIADVQGDIQVLIPASIQNSSKLETVTIKNVNNLKEVSGSYAQFYYTPGSQAGALTGGSPRAQFIRTSENVYVPSDALTQQMFSIYYHVQNLNDFNAQISPELKQTNPFYVGLNTLVTGGRDNAHNNAFFDGESNALLFVPYSLSHIPITVNSGIIAHEFFHSMFFKYVLKNFNASQDSLLQSAENSKKYFYNQTYIRGLNEGLADFWGWLYTNNTDYISLSLPSYGVARKIELDPVLVGQIETEMEIENKIVEVEALNGDTVENLSAYIYKIGTPHARFLKELTGKISQDQKIELGQAKLIMAQSIFNYLKLLSTKSTHLKNEMAGMTPSDHESKLAADDMFQYFATTKLSGIKLNKVDCDFVLKYVKSVKNKNLCLGTNVK